MKKPIFRKEAFLSIVGEPTNQLKKGKVITTVTMVESATVKEAQKESPEGNRFRKTYEFSLEDYNKHGDDLYKLGIANDPELQEVK